MVDKETMAYLLGIVFILWFIIVFIIETREDKRKADKRRREYESIQRRLAVRRK